MLCILFIKTFSGFNGLALILFAFEQCSYVIGSAYKFSNYIYSINFITILIINIIINFIIFELIFKFTNIVHLKCNFLNFHSIEQAQTGRNAY